VIESWRERERERGRRDAGCREERDFFMIIIKLGNATVLLNVLGSIVAFPRNNKI
jgi:hypothetical protein